MKELNEGRFLHVQSQIYDNEFRVPSFLCCTQNYPHQPTLFIIIPIDKNIEKKKEK